jgi:hypothetical protein
MKTKPHSPRWGWLYAIFGLMLALFYVEARAALSPNTRIFAQLGILAVVYVLTNLWINSNLPFDSWS